MVCLLKEIKGKQKIKESLFSIGYPFIALLVNSMKHSCPRILLVLAFNIFLPGEVFSQAFRWDVKTLTDSSGIDWEGEIAKTVHRRYTSIEGLTVKEEQFHSCQSVGLNSRREDERRVVKMKVRLIEVKKEANDNDYHIVIQSLTDSDNFMVTEIPDPGGAEYEGVEYSDLRVRLAGLRATVEGLLDDNVTQSFKDFPPNIIVKLYGVPFWDCHHPGEVSGAAKDFREIHPVLEMDEMQP